MKFKLLLLLFILSINCCVAQSKEELIDAIAKTNRLDGAQTGYSGGPSEQYLNFEKLKEMLNNDELLTLSKHENGVLRMYACKALIKNKTADVFSLYKTELERQEQVNSSSGCVAFGEQTSNILYETYWHEIQFTAGDTLIYFPNDKPIPKMSKRAEKDIVMQRIDSLTLVTDRSVPPQTWLLLFSGKKDKQYLPKIEHLAFNQNNALAMEYLLAHYPNRYKKRAEEYYTTTFAAISFNSGNEIIYYHHFIEMLLDSGKTKLRDIALNKLKKDDLGENKDLFNQLLEERNLPVIP